MPHEDQQNKLPNFTSEEEEPHVPAHVGSHLAGQHLGRKGLEYWWMPN